MKKAILMLLVVIGGLVSSQLFTGCAGACQRMDANGSIIGSTNGDWVVVKQSGGHITDVYKLENVMVQSENGSDGWLFLDHNGNPAHIGGDMKAIRCNHDKDEVFSQYVEYHMEWDTCTYQEKYQESLKQKAVTDSQNFKHK